MRIVVQIFMIKTQNNYDKDPEYTPQLDNLSVVNNDNTFVNDDYGVGDNDNINDVNYSKSY